MLNILGVSGSMRDASVSARLAQRVLDSARQHGAQTRLLDLHEIDLPMFRNSAPQTEHSGRLTADEAVNWAQAFVLVTPDYHGSMSGAMKNFLDHYWREFAGKLFGYGCVSQEKGLTVMDQVRTAVRQCYGWSLPYGLSVSRADFQDEIISNPTAAQRARMMGRDLTIYGSLLNSQFEQDLQCDESDTFAAHYR